MVNINDYVTRKSHNNDIVFQVIDKKNNIVYLRGIEIRLIADALEDDLIKVEKRDIKEDDFAKNLFQEQNLNRSDYFYIPGKILHIDGDSEYLKKCIEFYKKFNVLAYGKQMNEAEMPNNVTKYLAEINPDVLVITGHDAYNKSTKNYKNSQSFIETVRKARKLEKCSENLVIIAGACQSDYEGLIKAGSTFASSPKKINIHALDPAIIAVSISCLDKNKEVDLIKTLEKTKYGSDGIGGIKTKGMMYTGYPRNETK